MSLSPPDMLFNRIQTAIAVQSWREAWALLEQANPDYYGDDRHLGARRHDFLLATATCLRHRGQLEDAERVYLILQHELGLLDQRLADVLIGRGEVAHAAGRHGEALQLLRAASYIPDQDMVLRARTATINAHINSHVNIDLSLTLFEKAEQEFAVLDGTAAANLKFWHGDALLVGSRYQAAMEKLSEAQQLAAASGASVTLADTMRRLALARALLGHQDHALRSLSDLQSAEELYSASGDRGAVYLHTEAGEVHRSMGRWREAETAFSKGLWASRDIGDTNRQAHNQLGLFEIGRQTGRVKDDLLVEADRLYSRDDSDWGRLHVLISRAVNEPKTRGEQITRAMDVINNSSFSSFQQEKQILEWIKQADEDQIANYPHLMNYP